MGIRRLLASLIAIVATACSCSPARQAQPDQQAGQGMSRAPKVIYQIFPRSFQDGAGASGHGDLEGVLSRLDYLSGAPTSLGVDAVWLNPIFPSPSYHGYNATDYENVNPDFGDLSKLRKLVDEIHRRGMKVILDLAVVYSSVKHPWFQNRELYLWSPTPLDWKAALGAWHALNGAYYFSSFGSGSDADYDWRRPEVYARIRDVFLYWAGFGVDGFRLDAAMYLVKGPNGERNQPETHAIWKRLVSDVRAAHPDAYFIGEVWDSQSVIAQYYGDGDGDELDACFDFPVSAGLRSSLQARDAGDFIQSLKERLAIGPSESFGAPFLGNHDMDRVADTVNGDFARLKLGAMAVLTLPGTPTIYYGDEIGMPGGHLPAHKGDLGKRTPMPWDTTPSHGFTQATPWNMFSQIAAGGTVAEQSADPKSLLSLYRALIALREGDETLQSGELLSVQQPAKSVIAYFRRIEGENTLRLILLNFGASPTGPLRVALPQISISSRLLLSTGGSVDAGTVSANGQSWRLPALGAAAGAIFEVTSAPRRGSG